MQKVIKAFFYSLIVVLSFQLLSCFSNFKDMLKNVKRYIQGEKLSMLVFTRTITIAFYVHSIHQHQTVFISGTIKKEFCSFSFKISQKQSN
jgi:hypothetical protein